MELEIRPEPTPEERRAIVEALSSGVDGSMPETLRSRWRLRGVREGTTEPAFVPFGPAYVTARPRSRPGATRA